MRFLLRYFKNFFDFSVYRLPVIVLHICDRLRHFNVRCSISMAETPLHLPVPGHDTPPGTPIFLQQSFGLMLQGRQTDARLVPFDLGNHQFFMKVVHRNQVDLVLVATPPVTAVSF